MRAAASDRGCSILSQLQAGRPKGSKAATVRKGREPDMSSEGKMGTRTSDAEVVAECSC